MKNIVARGRLSDARHIELAEPVNVVNGEVEVTIRELAGPSGQDVFQLIAALPAGRRSKLETRPAGPGRARAMGGAVSRVYLDACSIIYLVEASNPFHKTIVRRLLRYHSDPASCLITSRLSLLECRTRPLRVKDAVTLGAYDAFFAAARLVICEMTAAVVERATSFEPSMASELPTRFTWRLPSKSTPTCFLAATPPCLAAPT